MTRRSGFESRKLVAIRQCFVQHIYWTSPNMTVLKLGLGPSSSSENVIRAQSIRETWHVVEEMDSMKNGKCPQLGIGNLRPMNGGME
mmetsp:Transcript_23684/g.47570  ORF Transcript_23684/g.47570 Transcript_23684/m.47570 type:complete len:87 (-) Transcript_23684:51-311(-)